MMVACSVCESEVEEGQVARLLSWALCPAHAELAIHASRQLNEAFAGMGIDAATQADILEAGQGIFRAWQAVGAMRSRKAMDHGQ